MLNQSLDQNEIITIKWANDDPNPRASERTSLENEKLIVDAVMKRIKRTEVWNKAKKYTLNAIDLLLWCIQKSYKALNFILTFSPLSFIFKPLQQQEQQIPLDSNAIGPHINEGAMQGYGVPYSTDVEERKLEIIESCQKMSEVLRRIDENKENDEDGDENFLKELTENFEKYKDTSYTDNYKDLFVSPDSNNQPLFFK
jgi:hypothetical protein